MSLQYRVSGLKQSCLVNVLVSLYCWSAILNLAFSTICVILIVPVQCLVFLRIHEVTGSRLGCNTGCPHCEFPLVFSEPLRRFRTITLTWAPRSSIHIPCGVVIHKLFLFGALFKVRCTEIVKLLFFIRALWLPFSVGCGSAYRPVTEYQSNDGPTYTSISRLTSLTLLPNILSQQRNFVK